MRELVLEEGRFRHYSPEEAARDFVPLRDRIFYVSGGVDPILDRIFRDPTWTRVIIQGALMFSNRSPQPDPHDSTRLWSDPDDPRDELQPLFDILAEDGIDEVIHMSPYTEPSRKATDPELIEGAVDAAGTEPTSACTRTQDNMSNATFLQERLLFDRTGRWGLFASWEMFGLLGGEPGFMTRFVEKSGGWGFIRKKADVYWQTVIDSNGYEAPHVPHYYALAGWNNPPIKRASPS